MMPRSPGSTRAIIFDLDTAVIDRRRAWQYAIEEAILTVAGHRVAAASLAGEYHARPWSHALAILIEDREVRVRCETVAEQYFRRSALKRLLVFDGIGMALDQLRGDRVDMGGISRERHADAMRQIESTGVDRFLTVLSPSNEGTWDPAARFGECLDYLQRQPSDAVFVSAHAGDIDSVAATGAATLLAGWSATGDETGALPHPSGLAGISALP